MDANISALLTTFTSRGLPSMRLRTCLAMQRIAVQVECRMRLRQPENRVNANKGSRPLKIFPQAGLRAALADVLRPLRPKCPDSFAPKRPIGSQQPTPAFPLNAKPGQTLFDIDPKSLSAGRPNLVASKLANQMRLVKNGIERKTPIEVTPKGVIYDGNHGVAARAAVGQPVTVVVIDNAAVPHGPVSELPIRDH